MQNSPMISVIVPVYNAEKYLDKCINSITSQTYSSLEIILVDDGSQDASGQICDSYAEKDSRIIVIHKENGGQSTARNAALHVAEGSYIGFVDADDWIEPDMYELLLKAICDTNADIAVCGRYRVDAETGERTEIFCHDGIFSVDVESAVRRFLLWDGIDGASCDKLFRKEVIENVYYPVESYICEDLPFVYYALKKANTVCMVGKALYNYVQTTNSTSRSSFSEKSMGLIVYAKEIQNDVILTYPKLKDEAEFFFLKNKFLFLKQFYDGNHGRRLPISYKLSEFNNHYVSISVKAKVALMKMNIFLPIKIIIRAVKGK